MAARAYRWVIVGALALAALAPAALAQAQPRGAVNGGMRFTGRFAGWQQRIGTGPGMTPVAPAGTIVTYPNAPTQHPAILQNMQQMRATSPRPNTYLNGQYNPVYRPVGNTRDPYRPGYYYGGYYYPYGLPAGYVYGGGGLYVSGGYAVAVPGGLPTWNTIVPSYEGWSTPYLPSGGVYYVAPGF